jgi:CheY-like chemotaxis protein
MPSTVSASDLRVFVAEDNAIVRNILVANLSELGAAVVGAVADGLSAVHWIDEHPGAADLLLTDDDLPLVSGEELIRRLRCRHPSLRFLLLCTRAAELVPDQRVAVMPKSVAKTELARALAALVTNSTTGVSSVRGHP